MKTKLLLLFLLLTACGVSAQEERSYVRKGNQKYIEGKYEDAEKEYNQALEIKNTLPEGVFNLGDVAYKKKDYQKATQQFETAAMLAKDNQMKAKAYHNLGNTYLDAQQYDKSIEAYKNALRLNPNDMDTKYNLAYAQQMLKKNPQQNQQNQDKNQDNKDKKDQNQQNKQDQQNQQDQQANQDKKEGEQKEQQQQQSEEQKAKEEQAKEQQTQPKEGQISKEDAQRLLEALMQQEQKVQQQIVNKKLPPAEKKKVDKDW